MQNQFLELSFRNHIRNNDNILEPYEKIFEPIMENLREILSVKACDEIEEKLNDCMNEALYVAGVLGMELAIGVINGTIQQRIE